MFIPKSILLEQEALNYETGRRIKLRCEEKGIPFKILNSNRVLIEGDNAKEKYEKAKDTLVVGVRKTLEFENCKPSAHYQLPLVTGCMGMCEYCYLNTRLGNRNYIRIYVNTEEILEKAKLYIEKRKPEITIFEGAATSDPIPVEAYTKNLEKAIIFFGKEEYGRFRFVTKYPLVESLLELPHKGHTEIRFSLNTDTVIQQYEHRTASRIQRINGLVKAMKANYPAGVIIAPVFIYENWKTEYTSLLEELRQKMEAEKVGQTPTFEVITHRYTMAAKNRIQDFYPDTTLDMVEENRKFKYGQFGYGKYVYKPEQIQEVKDFFQEKIKAYFPESKILYII